MITKIQTRHPLNKQYVYLTHCGLLSDFFSDTPAMDVEIVNGFLHEESATQVLLIRSEMGNGGTHLLSGAANVLLERGEVIACLSSEMLVRNMLIMADELRKYVMGCTHLCIDYIDHTASRPDAFAKLQLLLQDYLQAGGRIIVSSSTEWTIQRLKQFLGPVSVVQVTTHYPDLPTLKKIGATNVSEQLVEELADKIYAEGDSCVRTFIGKLIAVDARRSMNLNK
jgi:chromosomal replication initiation ATPase DnaA